METLFRIVRVEPKAAGAQDTPEAVREATVYISSSGFASAVADCPPEEASRIFLPPVAITALDVLDAQRSRSRECLVAYGGTAGLVRLHRYPPPPTPWQQGQASPPNLDRESIGENS